MSRVQAGAPHTSAPSISVSVDRGRLAEEIGIEELRALHISDEVMLPEEVAVHGGANPFAQSHGLPADDFPPPPVTARSGEAIFQSLGRVAVAELPSFSSESALVAGMSGEERAESIAKAFALLRGIHGLESEIRERVVAQRRA